MGRTIHGALHFVGAVATGLVVLMLIGSLLGSVPHLTSQIRAVPAQSPHESFPVFTLPSGEIRAPTAQVHPSAPTLSSGGQSPAAIGLSWTDATSGTFTNFTILEASQATGWNFGTAWVETNQANTTYVALGLSPGVTYAWQVQENYQTCVIIFGCSAQSQTTNVLNLTQPPVAFLNDTAVSSTSATLEWTNNASYGTIVSFLGYTIWQEINGGAPSQLATISTQATTSYQATLLAGTSYSFFVKTSDCTSGCGGGTPTTSVTQSNLITLGTPQTLSVTVFAQHTTIDLGQSDFFTCTPNGGKSPFGYAWDFANGTFVAGPASKSFTLRTTGALTVRCQVTDAEPSTSSNSAFVQVDPPLAVDVAVNRTAADVGQVIGFTCTVSNGTSPYSLAWSFGDGSSSAQSSPSYSYATRGNYAPTCLVHDSVGAGAAPATPIVISPRLSVAASTSSSTAAPGTALTFTATATNGSGTYSGYNWTFGAGVTATGAQVHHAFPTSQSPSVMVQVADSNGARASGGVSVVVSPIVVSVTPPSSSTRTGTALPFVASASGGAGGPYNYSWSFGDGNHGYGASVTHAYANAGTESPSLVVTDRLGATNHSALPTISVSTPPPPFNWFTSWLAVLLAAAFGLLVAFIVLVRSRRAESAELERTASPYVPPTDPRRTIRGSKTCEFCGESNLPIRTTCRHCGKPLPRSPGP
ncbi:MAG: PKD domain-containing protein [Thermoplasmata archaeon]|nr:PKD domain-containing protein [Thermoplasmata archaeon]